LDSIEIAVLSDELTGMGYSVYVDWIVDVQLDRERVNGETAKLLRHRMKNSKCLLYATSDNSHQSKWMPWELGYFDGLKDKVAILPIVDDRASQLDMYKGQEYVSIYPYITINPQQGYIEEKLWVRESETKYVNFDSWLIGMKPIQR